MRKKDDRALGKSSVNMGTEYKDVVDTNMEDSGNSCGSSVVSDLSGPSYQTDLFDGDGVQVSDLEGDLDPYDPLPLMQVGTLFTRGPWGCLTTPALSLTFDDLSSPGFISQVEKNDVLLPRIS